MEEKIKENKALKILGICFNVVFYLVILGLLVFAIASINSKKTSIPNIFGTGFLAINNEADSMEGEEEDSFKAGSLLIVKIASKKMIQALEIGDIITFYDYNIKALNTHRIVDIDRNSEGLITIVRTQGDKVALNPNYKYEIGTEDTNKLTYIETVSIDNIYAVYNGTKIDNGGKAISFLTTSKGFGLCILLPVGILLVIEAVLLVRNLLKLNKAKLAVQLEKEKEDNKLSLEEEKQRMREELLKEIQAEKEKEEKKDE